MFLLYTDAVHFLLKKGAGVNVRNNDGLTALHIAAETDNLPLCKELVNKGADVTAVCTSSKVSLLHVSSQNMLSDSFPWCKCSVIPGKVVIHSFKCLIQYKFILKFK